MTSEHISYKSTKPYLRNLYTKGSHVVQGPGENAGIIDIGGGYCIALRIESHNHPTYINPFEGAATGVGGILRDIFTMGARPIALLDFLRFGQDEDSNALLHKAIEGISYYTNCIGVANVGGDLYRGETYNKNPLVNIACLGIVKKENIIYGNVLNKDSVLIYVGSKTGYEGVDGAAMASQELDKVFNKNIQKSDPFLEKLLLEACCEIAELKLAEGMQDMGAGGILCATIEVIKRGREKTKHNFGCEINLEKVPLKSEMDPYSILASESQERMLIISTQENKEKIEEIFKKWDLEYSIIGKVTETGFYSVYNNNKLIYYELMKNYIEYEQIWDEVTIVEKTIQTEKIKNMDLWEVYDTSIGNRTIKGPSKPESYAILYIYENNKKLIISWGEEFMECYETMKKYQGTPLALINCLNFGNPAKCMGNFAHRISELNKLCQKYKIPIVGGNVSLYNATDGISIKSTIVLVMVGLL